MTEQSGRRPRKVWGWGVGLLLVGMLVGRGIMGLGCADAKPSRRPSPAELPFFAGLPRVLDIAHRGASRDAPEHSAEAYDLALRQGAHVLELDLRTTRDGVLLVAHDASLERTLGLSQRWSELSWEQVRELAGARAPLRLEGVFERFGQSRFNLELKDEDPRAAAALAQLVTERDLQGRVLVASAHAHMLREFRRASAGVVATSASTREVLAFYVRYLLTRTLPWGPDASCPAPYVALQLPALDWLGLTGSRFLQYAHSQGLVVHFWTIDGEAAMRALIAAGADGIMTNRPDVLARVLASGDF